MKKIVRSAIVPFRSEQMYELVNDIERYPEFMPGCVAAKIIERGDDWLEAELELKKAGFQQSFVTRNVLEEGARISMSLVKGPFKSLVGAWEFAPLSDSACKVSFWLEFEMSNSLLALAAGKVFEKVASEQVDVICKRAKQIY